MTLPILLDTAAERQAHRCLLASVRQDCGLAASKKWHFCTIQRGQHGPDECCCFPPARRWTTVDAFEQGCVCSYKSMSDSNTI